MSTIGIRPYLAAVGVLVGFLARADEQAGVRLFHFM